MTVRPLFQYIILFENYKHTYITVNDEIKLKENNNLFKNII